MRTYKKNRIIKSRNKSRKNSRKNSRKTKKQRGGVKSKGKSKPATYKSTHHYYKENPHAPTAPKPSRTLLSIFQKPHESQKLKSSINAPHPDPNIQKLLEERREKIKTKQSSFRSILPGWVPGSTKQSVLKANRKLVGTNAMTKIPRDIALATLPFLDNQQQFEIVFDPNKLNRIYKLSIHYVMEIGTDDPNITKFAQLLLFFERLLLPNINHPDPSKNITSNILLELAKYIKDRLNGDKAAMKKILQKIGYQEKILQKKGYQDMSEELRWIKKMNCMNNLYNFLRFYIYLSCPKKENGEPIDSGIPIPIIYEYRTKVDTINVDEGIEIEETDYDVEFIKEMPINRMLNRFLVTDYQIYEKMKTEGITPFFFWIAHHYMTNATSDEKYDFSIGSPEIVEHAMSLEIVDWEYDENFDGPVDFLLDSTKEEDRTEFERRMMTVVGRNIITWGFGSNGNGVVAINPETHPEAHAMLQKTMEQFPDLFFNNI
jgi:hypothetical protein